jgi:ABC-type uncharacterized transport system involved in gliding motility auxiliary subunit
MNQASKTLSGAAGLLIVLAILVVLNVLVSPLSLRSDLTEEKLYTLSNGTRGLLKDLERPVSLKFYFSEGAEGIPGPLKQYASRVRDLLREYERASGGKLTLETFDPEPDSDEEEWAQRYGLAGQSLNPLGGTPIYFGVAAVSGTREAVIPFFAPQIEPQLEYLLTRLVDEVVRVKKSVVGIMSTLPVQGAAANPFGPPTGARPWALISELNRQFETRELLPEASEVSNDIDLLVLIHPKNLSEKTLFAIDQFVLRGGRLLALMDPLSIVDESTRQPGMMMQSPGGSSDLNRLSEAWGFSLSGGTVVADARAASTLNLGAGNVAEIFAFLSLKAANINKKDIATGMLENLTLPFAGAFEGEAADGLVAEHLIFSSEDSALVSSFMATQPGRQVMDSGTRKEGLPLAIRLTGRFPTAFPDGAPKGEDVEKETPVDNILSESSADSIVVLIGDVDFANDSYATREVNLFGQRIIQPANDNLNLVINLVEQLSGSEALIGLRSRGTFNRPFDKVETIAREAQQKWQAEEKQLTQKLQEAQARLAQLQNTKSSDQQFIVTPEQAAEIEKFRTERFDTQKRLREVRKNLRKDIEQLGFRLKAVNLTAMPVLITAFGLLRWHRRRKKAEEGKE